MCVTQPWVASLVVIQARAYFFMLHLFALPMSLIFLFLFIIGVSSCLRAVETLFGLSSSADFLYSIA
jgi:hypothetical protein